MEAPAKGRLGTHCVDPTELLAHGQTDDCNQLPADATVSKELPGLLRLLSSEGKVLSLDIL